QGRRLSSHVAAIWSSGLVALVSTWAFRKSGSLRSIFEVILAMSLAFGSDQMDDFLRHVTEMGFAIIPGVLSDEELGFVRQELDRIYPLYDPDRDGLRRVPGSNFSSNLVNKSPFFETLFLRHPVYDLARRLLGEDCILSSLNSLEPLQGQGNQGLHRDGP